MSAHIYIDGEIFELADVQGLAPVEGGGGLVALRSGGGAVIGYVKVGDAAFVTLGEAPIPLSFSLDEDGEEEEE